MLTTGLWIACGVLGGWCVRLAAVCRSLRRDLEHTREVAAWRGQLLSRHAADMNALADRLGRA